MIISGWCSVSKRNRIIANKMKRKFCKSKNRKIQLELFQKIFIYVCILQDCHRQSNTPKHLEAIISFAFWAKMNFRNFKISSNNPQNPSKKGVLAPLLPFSLSKIHRANVSWVQYQQIKTGGDTRSKSRTNKIKLENLKVKKPYQSKWESYEVSKSYQ